MIDMHVGFTGGEFRPKRPQGYVDVAMRQIEVFGLVAQKRWRPAARAQLEAWRTLGTVAYRDARALLDRLRPR